MSKTQKITAGAKMKKLDIAGLQEAYAGAAGTSKGDRHDHASEERHV
jgi:hypothetical protein